MGASVVQARGLSLFGVGLVRCGYQPILYPRADSGETDRGLEMAESEGGAVGSQGVETVVRLLVAFGLSYVLGFERQLRGSQAGDRTFSLIGVGTAMIGIVAAHGAPNALAGAVTGIGFIGGGLAFRQATKQGEVLRGLTTAAAIFAAAAIGAAAGEGFLLAAIVGTAIVLLILELRHIPGLRALDAQRWSAHFVKDDAADLATETDADHPL